MTRLKKQRQYSQRSVVEKSKRVSIKSDGAKKKNPS